MSGTTVCGLTLEPHDQLSTLGNLDDRTTLLDPEDEIPPFLLLEEDSIHGGRRGLKGEAFLPEKSGQLAEMVIEGLESVQEIRGEQFGPRLHIQGIKNLGKDLRVLTGNGEDAIRELGKFHRVDQVSIPVQAGFPQPESVP